MNVAFFRRPARVACFVAVILVLLPPPCAVAAQKGSYLDAAPLADDYGGGRAPVVSLPSEVGSEIPADAEAVRNPIAPSTAVPAANDGAVMAYLIELARKQGKACPSGETPPLPPPLLFSEPLCRVAGAVAEGADPMEAIGAQGLYAARWRTFSAPDYPAQRVVSALRHSHCEALMEPHTHVGAARGANGWSIILAELTQRPPVEERASDSAASPEMLVPPAVLPATAQTPEASGATAATGDKSASLPGEGDAPLLFAKAESGERDKAAGVTGQEARALFILVNELREKGGSCLGKPAVTAPPLNFNPVLQAAAEASVVEAAAAAGFGESQRNPDRILGLEAYEGTQATKLYAVTSATASAVLDVWMLSPDRCKTLLSPMLTDMGVAASNGHWVVILGGKGKGVPSPEPPGAADNINTVSSGR